MTARRHHVLNGTTKYKHALECGKSIADIMSRNGTFVFGEMMNALEKFEDIIKDGVAPFVGREGEWVDPLSQLSSLTFSPTLNTNAVEPKDAVMKSDTEDEEKIKNTSTANSDDDEPPTQQSAPLATMQCATATMQEPTVTPCVTRGTSHVTLTPPATQEPLCVTRGNSCVTLTTPEVDAASMSDFKQNPSQSKRQHISSSSSESSQSGSFVITKSAKSRGRPQVRKKQGKAEKKQRIENSKKKASKLVQGTLAPVPSVRNIAKLLDNNYTYEDAKKVLPNLTIRAVPKTKKANAGIYLEDECICDVRFVFPKQFVEKCLAAVAAFRKGLIETVDDDTIGVRVPRFGIFQYQDIVAMDRWHASMQYLSATEDAITWAVNTSVKRLSLPVKIDDGVSSDPTEREVIIRRILLKGGRETSFGSVPYNGLLTLRENMWMDDSCMGHGIALLQREHPDVGIVNPIFNRFHDKDARLRAINAGKPFKKTNQIILLPLHIDNNHWCGAIFDYRSERRGVLVFDPLQDPKSKYYAKCEELLKDVFLEGEDSSIPLPIQRVTNVRQPDFSSCGAAVLLFFECYLTGIDMPEKLSHASMRFFRLRYMLKCLQ